MNRNWTHLSPCTISCKNNSNASSWYWTHMKMYAMNWTKYWWKWYEICYHRLQSIVRNCCHFLQPFYRMVTLSSIYMIDDTLWSQIIPVDTIIYHFESVYHATSFLAFNIEVATGVLNFNMNLHRWIRVMLFLRY